jgi:hypothetical protein
LVAAINEIKGEIGDLEDLEVDEVETLVEAINVVTVAIGSAISGVVDTAPAELNTLKKLATAINNDHQFSVTMAGLFNDVVDNLGGKLDAADAGDFEDLLTEEQDTLVGAINEVVGMVEETQRGRSFSGFIYGEVIVAAEEIMVIAPCELDIVKIRLAVGSAPTGSDLIIDVNINGTSIFTDPLDRPKIIAGNTSGAVLDIIDVSVVEGDVVSIDVDQVGSILPGTNLSIAVIFLIHSMVVLN